MKYIKVNEYENIVIINIKKIKLCNPTDIYESEPTTNNYINNSEIYSMIPKTLQDITLEVKPYECLEVLFEGQNDLKIIRLYATMNSTIHQLLGIFEIITRYEIKQLHVNLDGHLFDVCQDCLNGKLPNIEELCLNGWGTDIYHNYIIMCILNEAINPLNIKVFEIKLCITNKFHPEIVYKFIGNLKNLEYLRVNIRFEIKHLTDCEWYKYLLNLKHLKAMKLYFHKDHFKDVLEIMKQMTSLKNVLLDWNIVPPEHYTKRDRLESLYYLCPSIQEYEERLWDHEKGTCCYHYPLQELSLRTKLVSWLKNLNKDVIKMILLKFPQINF